MVWPSEAFILCAKTRPMTSLAKGHDQRDGPRWIGFRRCDAQDDRQRGSACGQMQKVAPGKFHEFSPKINLKDELQIRNARRPMAPTLPIATIGSPARPAGSLGKMLHQLCELAKGTTRTFLLQRMSPLMAHLGRFARRTKVVSYLRYGGRAGRMAAVAVVDPNRNSTESPK
jgi:hypothetical protein